MRERIKSFLMQEFFSNSLVHWLLIGTIFLGIIDFGTLFFFVRPVDFPIVLHYNVYFGVDIIGMWWQAYLVPMVSVLIVITNTILAYIFFKQRERIISYLFLLASFLVQASVSVAIASVIIINY